MAALGHQGVTMDLLTLLLACEVWITFAYTLYRKEFFAGQISSWYIAGIMLAGIGTFLTLCAFDLVYMGFDVESFMRIKLILA